MEPAQVAFATNGYASPRDGLKWRQGFREAGKDLVYDVYPDLTVRPSGVRALPLQGGGRRIIGNTKGSVLRVARGFARADGGQYGENPVTVRRELSVRGMSWSLPLGADMRRLAMKCFVALAAANDVAALVAPHARKYLFAPEEHDAPDFRLDFSVPSAAPESHVPSHRVFVECEGPGRPVVGLFRPFDLASIYCVLNESYAGPSCAFSARLSLVDLTETISSTGHIGLQLPPVKKLRWLVAYDQLRGLQRIDRYTEMKFGRVRLRFGPSLPGLRLSCASP